MHIDINTTRSSHPKVIIKGIVKSIDDSKQIKDVIENVTENARNLTLEFVDSFALTSSVIGYLTKKVHADKVHLEVLVHNDQLFELLDMLSLTAEFNVKKL